VAEQYRRGGEDPEIYRDGGEANNRVKQVASARFGVTAEYLVHADELEIKIAQGANPAKAASFQPARFRSTSRACGTLCRE